MRLTSRTKNLTASAWPFLDATCNGERPLTFVLFANDSIFASRRSSGRILNGDSFDLANCKSACNREIMFSFAARCQIVQSSLSPRRADRRSGLRSNKAIVRDSSPDLAALRIISASSEYPELQAHAPSVLPMGRMYQLPFRCQ